MQSSWGTPKQHERASSYSVVVERLRRDTCSRNPHLIDAATLRIFTGT